MPPLQSDLHKPVPKQQVKQSAVSQDELVMQQYLKQFYPIGDDYWLMREIG
jgi:hypothetical protein